MIHQLPKYLFLLLSLFGYSQRVDDFNNIEIDSINSIILLDAYNDNYEREWGRKYLIEPKKDGYTIFKIEEFYQNYVFDEKNINYDSLLLLKSTGVSKPKLKRLTKKVNERNTQRNKIKERIDSIVWGTTEKPENWQGKRKLGNVEKNSIENFISILNSKYILPSHYLKNNGIDSIWLKKNADRLYNQWFETNPTAKSKSKINIMDALKDFKVFKKTFFSILLTGNFTNYPHFEIILVNKNLDSIKLISRGQSHFQIPWELKEKKIYNPELAISISKLIPDEQFYSIRKRLNPDWEKIEKTILNNILSTYNSEQNRKK